MSTWPVEAEDESFALLFLAKFLFRLRSFTELGRKFLVLLPPWTTSEADSDTESDPSAL